MKGKKVKIRYDSFLPQIIGSCEDFPAGKRFEEEDRGKVFELEEFLALELVSGGHFRPADQQVQEKKKEGKDE